MKLAFIGVLAACSEQKKTPPPPPPWTVNVEVAQGASWCVSGPPAASQDASEACTTASVASHGVGLLRTGREGRATLKLDPSTTAELGPGAAIALRDGSPRVIEVTDGVVTLRHETPESGSGEAGPKLAVQVLDQTGELRAPLSVARIRARASRSGPGAVVSVERGGLRFGPDVALESGETASIARGRGVDRRAGYSGEVARVERPILQERSRDTAPRGLGTMTARVPGTDRVVAGVRLASHHVRAFVQRGFARTEVEEVFQNDTDTTLEGRYVFAVPPNAVTARLALWVEGKLVEDEIVERGRAAAIFKNIVDDTVRPRDPALLEWVASGELSLKVFPIPPKSSRKVLLAYDESLKISGGEARYVYPLSLGENRANTIDDLSIHVTATDPDGIPEDVTTPHYPADLAQADHEVSATFDAKGYAPTADFVLAWRRPRSGLVDAAAFVPALGAQGKQAELGLDRTAKAAGDQSYFALRLAASLPKDAPLPAHHKRDRVVAIDTSFSQSKETLDAATRLALQAVQELDTDEKFALLACDSACRAYPEQGLSASSTEALAKAEAWLRGLSTGGSSDLAGALVTAAARVGEGGQVLYVGDGAATSGELHPQRLAKRARAALGKKKADVRLVGVGSTLDAAALVALARELGATYQGLANGEPVARRLDHVVSSLRAPVVRAPKVELPGYMSEVYPRSLPNLVLGEDVLLVGKLGKVEDGTAKLTGELDGAPWATDVAIAWGSGAERQATIVPRLWAAQRIDDLVASGGADAKKEVVELSKRFHVLSRYTSMLVLENDAMYAEMGIARTTSHGSARGPASGVSAAQAAQLEQMQLQLLGALGGTSGGTLTPLSPGLGDGAGGRAAGGSAASGSGLSGLGGLGSASETKVAGPLGTVQVGAVSTKGAPVADAARIIAGLRPRFRACYQQGLNADPTMAGALRLVAQIAPNGSVASTELPECRLSAAVCSCVQRTVNNAHFSPPEGGPAALAVTVKMVQQERPTSPSPSFPPTFREPPPPQTTAVTRASDDAWRSAGEDALTKLRAAVAKEPRSRQRLEGLVRGLLTRGRFEDAKKEAGTFAEQDPDSPVARDLLSYAAASSGDVPGALAAVDSVVETAPLAQKSHVRAARAFEAAGDEIRACAHWRSLVDLEPTDDAWRFESLRCRAKVLGERDEALAEAKGIEKPGKLVAKLLPLLESGAVPAFDPAHSLPGELEVTVTCAPGAPAASCPAPLVVAPNGTVFSPYTPADARSGAHAVAITVLRDGAYHVLLVGGAPDASGEIVVRAPGTTQKLPFTKGGLQSIAVTQVTVPPASLGIGLGRTLFW